MKRKGQRRYDDGELAAILDRAARVHGSTALVPVERGRTLEEVRAIAAEAGIDAASVDLAVQALDEREAPSLPIVGRSPRMELVRTLSGEVSAEDRRELVGILQRTFDATGRLIESERGAEWRHLGWFGRELVVITSRKGKTRIEVRGRYRRGFVATFAAGGLAGVMTTVGLLDLLGLLNVFEAAAVPLVLLAAVVAGRTTWGWFAGAKERSLRRLADRLGETIDEELVGPPALPPAHDREDD